MGLALVTVKNMKEPLISRYTSNWPGPYTNTAELFYAGQKHQRQMIALADRQIQAQKAAAGEIAASNIEAAEVIAREISQQTDLLATTIGEMSSDIRQAVAHLGDRICGSLDEIKWQLAQQGETLSRILTTLLNNRNNEAKQLVLQGRRHMDNGEYAEAEDRFCLALKYDSTDYQVLLSLAFIEMNKGSAEAAFRYFRKSLTLPDSLDDDEKARALWALARLHYAEHQYKEALEIAARALALEKSPTGVSLFTVGVYAALAGNTDMCFKKIRSAIDADATFFAKAAVEPNLENVRLQVLQMLSEIAARAYANTRSQIICLRKDFEKSTKGGFESSYRDLLEIARQHLEQAEAKLKSASYTDCLKLDYSVKALREAIAVLILLEPLCEQHSRAGETGQAVVDRHRIVVDSIGAMAKEEPVGKTGCLFTLMLYAIPGLCSYLSALMLPGHPVDLAVFLGVFVAPLVWPMFFLLFNPSGRAEMYPGLIVGLVVTSMIWIYWRWLPKRKLEAAQQDNAYKRDQIAKSASEVREACAHESNLAEKIERMKDTIRKCFSTPPADAATVPTAAATAEAEVGKIYRGKVFNIIEFGAFVEFLPGKIGLVHISELADFRVNRVEDVCKLGDEIMVKCIGIDDKGKCRFSRRAALRS